MLDIDIFLLINLKSLLIRETCSYYGIGLRIHIFFDVFIITCGILLFNILKVFWNSLI